MLTSWGRNKIWLITVCVKYNFPIKLSTKWQLHLHSHLQQLRPHPPQLLLMSHSSQLWLIIMLIFAHDGTSLGAARVRLVITICTAQKSTTTTECLKTQFLRWQLDACSKRTNNTKQKNNVNVKEKKLKFFLKRIYYFSPKQQQQQQQLVSQNVISFL